MSPFRKVLERYNLLWLAAGMLICMLISICVSINASERQREESDRKLCASVASDVAAYMEAPPVTEAGRNQLRAKLELLRTLKCPDGNNGKGSK